MPGSIPEIRLNSFKRAVWISQHAGGNLRGRHKTLRHGVLREKTSRSDYIDQIKRPLPLLPDGRSRLSLRVVEQAVSTAKDYLTAEAIGETHARPNRAVICGHVRRTRNTALAGNQYGTIRRIEVHPVVVRLMVGHVNFVMESKIER